VMDLLVIKKEFFLRNSLAFNANFPYGNKLF